VASRSDTYKERQRQRAKARKLVHEHVGTEVFLAAQNWTCPICNQRLTSKMKLSVDHVYNFAGSKRNAGNLLLVHEQCNFDKDDRHPSRSEQEMLGLVNRCLQYCKGIYRTVPPPAARGRIGEAVIPRVFVIQELTPSEFFFKMLTEALFLAKIKFDERFRNDTL
jgi:hypothetical protein